LTGPFPLQLEAEKDTNAMLELQETGIMTAHTESLEAGDRVKLRDRTGVIELIVSDIFIIKWDWRKDCGAYTRDAVENEFSRYDAGPQPVAPRSRSPMWTSPSDPPR
jgi:hypothetical protein